MSHGTIESLEGLSLLFTMFSEDDKHNLVKAAESAKVGRLKLIEAAQAFRRAGNLIKSNKIRQEVDKHLKALDIGASIQDWIGRGILAPGTQKDYGDHQSLAIQGNLGELVEGYAAKFDLLAEYLEWPVQNLLSNRYAFRDDMMKIFSTISVVIHEASFLSQLFYEIPSSSRNNHMAWLSEERP